MLKNKEIKEVFDKTVSKKYKDDYEFERWFRTHRDWLDYYMTHESIENLLKNLDFSECLEVGPGPGTWTKLLFKKNPEANYHLFDISKEMEKQFRLEMRQHTNISYKVQDFMEAEIEKGSYDLFFSSRAIEYFEDKESLFHKISLSLRDGGRGIIVTKNRGFGFRRDNRKHHSGQLDSRELESLLNRSGLKVEVLYPAVFRLPIIDRFSPIFSKKFYKSQSQKPYKGWMKYFVESFIVSFYKP